MIDILLINPQPVVMKDLFAENLMYANPPLGLGYLASAARNAGYSVDLIDVGIDKLTISGIIHRIIEVDAQIVGISSFIANHGNGLKIAHEIKKQFGSQVKVMMGGPQASFVYEEVLKQRHIDSFADLYCSSSHAAFCLCSDGSNMALYHTSICRNWYAEQFPFSACRFQLSEYRWNEFLDTACYFDFGRN